MVMNSTFTEIDVYTALYTDKIHFNSLHLLVFREYFNMFDSADLLKQLFNLFVCRLYTAKDHLNIIYFLSADQ
jgi:hypothetical protein